VPKRCRAALATAVHDALAKNGLVAGAGGVTVEAAMKTLSAKAKIVELPFVPAALSLQP
jgi:hypothetical protein